MEYNHNLREHSRYLRKNMTKEEALLWYRFLRHYPLRFRRQYVIGNYIADFYCHQAKLVVELDGSQHCDPITQKYDQRRTAYLTSQDIHILRFSNLDVLRQFQSVCQVIDMVARERAEKTFSRGEGGPPLAGTDEDCGW